MAIRQTIETVTPDLAKKWLSTQEKNRKAVAAHVTFLKSVMERGAWGVAQPIIFDTRGRLIDGQHRLLALSEYGAPIKFSVMRGVEPSLWSALDTGRGRKGADVVSAEGRTSSNLLAAALRLVWQDEMGVLGSTAPDARPTNADILDRDAEHPEIGNEVIHAVSVNRFARNGSTVFLYWRTHGANKPVAEAFWAGVLSGEHLRRKTAPFLLHRLLIDQQAGARARRLTGLELLAYEIKAWNYALLDEEDAPAVLRWARGVEAFPPICATRAEAERVNRSSRGHRQVSQRVPDVVVQITVKPEEWNGQTRFKANWLNPGDYVPQGTTSSEGNLGAVDARFGSLLRAAAAAAMPKTATKPQPARPAPSAPPPAPAAGNQARCPISDEPLDASDPDEDRVPF